jgi:hypothetical protein
MKKRLDDATLSAVTVCRMIANITMDAHAKFNIGALLHNRNTNEDGWVRRVYRVGGAVMYEVSVPATPLMYNTSDWDESPLELANHKTNNKTLSLVRPTRDWSYQR